MSSNPGLSIKQIFPRETANVRKHFIHVLTLVCIGGMYLLLPLLPLLASIIAGRTKYVLHYWQTCKNMLIHIKALTEGPISHYFQDVAGRASSVPVEMQGSCVQCGNCCMDKRCAFLEAVGDEKYQCGIYHSPLRRFSNCGSFPLSAYDIDRYACPGYSILKEAIKEVPIHWVKLQAATLKLQ